MFKVNNRNTRTRWEIEIYFTPCSSVSIVNFEQANTGWGSKLKKITELIAKEKLGYSAQL